MILDGKAVAAQIRQELSFKYKDQSTALAFILIGDNPASHSYVSMKKRACEEVGIVSINIKLKENVSEKELLETIKKLNEDPAIDGILVQQPLPPHLLTEKITSAIDPTKDVDGFHPLNLGKLILQDPTGFIPCTPLGILELLKRYKIDLSSKRVLILGRSHIVGRPLSILLSQNAPYCNATVTTAHSKTENIKQLCLNSDVVIAAIGKPHFIQADMIHEGSIVIDVGINRVHDTIVGDVHFQEVQKKASYITPVPGGIGPMTIAMLMSNTLKKRKND
jgi:methylenetetrahydrofolate dehydrogenase (NADP+)/methenyltetrahydrofolate cyclohydrolase